MLNGKPPNSSWADVSIMQSQPSTQTVRKPRDALTLGTVALNKRRGPQ